MKNKLVVWLFAVSTMVLSQDVATLVVTGSVHGQLDPCGWPKKPLGGLSRKYTAINYLRSIGKDPIILDAGDLLFTKPDFNDSIRDSEIYRGMMMLEGIERIGCDAINVGQFELAAGLDVLKELSSKSSIPFLSANLLDPISQDLIFNPYTFIDKGGIKFGIIGLTDLISDTVKNVLSVDYIVAGNNYLNLIEEKVDIKILLINSDRSTYSKLTEIFPSADLIFTSGSTFMTRPMMDQKEDGPFVFSSGREGRYLNQFDIRLVDGSNKIVNKSYYESKVRYLKKRIDRYANKNPNLSLENIYIDQPEILENIKISRNEIKRMKNILLQNINSISFKNVAMSSEIKDNSEMFEYVKKALENTRELIARN